MSISIIGTGDFARALAKRLSKSGKKVLCGSRYPESRIIAGRDPELACMDVHVVSIENALKSSDVIFLALHSEYIEPALRGFQDLLQKKILVDVTNPSHVSKTSSHAEVLAKRYPEAFVVKAFNTISAYSLESDMDTGDKKVYIASNHKEASEHISTLARLMGYETQTYDSLTHAGRLESMQRHLFGDWAIALLILIPVFILWLVFNTVRYHVEYGYKWDSWPLHTFNKILATTSVTLLALCYLPGNIAAIIQLVRGTKHRSFPVWLDCWMRARKQLGLLALWFAAIHCIMSVAHNNPAYFKVFYNQAKFVIEANETEEIQVPLGSRMNWIGETTYTTGAFALAFMVILGITSLPSVGGRLNWCQWTFVQSYLGYVCLIISIAHVIIQSLPYTIGMPLSQTMKGVSTISLLLPVLTAGLRILLLLPCFGIPLYKIRRGWECCSSTSEAHGENSDMELNGKIKNSGNYDLGNGKLHSLSTDKTGQNGGMAEVHSNPVMENGLNE